MPQNMRKIIIFVLIILVIVFLGLTSVMKKRCASTAPEEGQALVIQSEFIGEKIIYDIKLGSIRLGGATFRYLDNANLDGKSVTFMTFETNLANFNDLEEIYSDPLTSLPLKVSRDIKGWTINEKITENYDQHKFVLDITKFKGDKKEEIQIKKEGPIHNAILLPFYLRQLPDLKPGWSFTAQLPNQQFLIKLVAIENLKLSSGTFETFRFESLPEKFQIWVTTDKRRIPVKIKGSGAFGYLFVMKEYNLEK